MRVEILSGDSGRCEVKLGGEGVRGQKAISGRIEDDKKLSARGLPERSPTSVLTTP